MTGQQISRLRGAVNKYQDSIKEARRDLANSTALLTAQLRYELKGGLDKKNTGKSRNERLQDEIAILYELFDVLCLEEPSLGFNPEKLFSDLATCRKEQESKQEEKT